MGWFSKKEDNSSRINSKNPDEDIPKLEELPDLPALPELPSISKTSYLKQEKLQPLPNLPNSSIRTNKLSQNSIKDAISNENEFDENLNYSKRTLQAYNPRSFEIQDNEIPYPFKEASIKSKKAEPIFVRLDKFEESLEIFEDIKQKVEEIKSILKDIKEKKSQEEQELQKWESQLQEMKHQIEKIDQDIFSKIE